MTKPLLSLFVCASFVPSLQAATVFGNLNSADVIIGEVQANADSVGYYADGTGISSTDIVGVTGSGTSQTRRSMNVVLGYTLPTLAVGQTLDAAVINFEITAVRDHNGDNPRLDVYLLDTANPDSTGASFYFRGETDTSTSVAYVGDQYIAPDANDGNEDTFADGTHDVSLSLTGSSLSLLQSFYGGDHTPDQSEAFFRFNLDVPIPGGTLGSGNVYDRYRVDLAPGESSLEITTVPEPAATLLCGLGLLILLRRRRNSFHLAGA